MIKRKHKRESVYSQRKDSHFSQALFDTAMSYGAVNDNAYIVSMGLRWGIKVVAWPTRDDPAWKHAHDVLSSWGEFWSRNSEYLFGCNYALRGSVKDDFDRAMHFRRELGISAQDVERQFGKIRGFDPGAKR